MTNAANAVVGQIPELLTAGGIYFSLFKMLLLLIWLGSGFPAQRIWARISAKCDPYLPFLRIVALCAGPLVFLGWGIRVLLEKQLEIRRQRLLQIAEKKQVKILDHSGTLLNGKSADGQSAETQFVLNQLQFILTSALDNRIHEVTLEPEGEKYGVRGKGQENAKKMLEIGKKEGCSLILLLKSICGADPYETQKPQQGTFRVLRNEESFLVSFASLGVAGGERVSLSFKNAEKALKELSACGMDADNLAFVRRLIAEARGMILVTGPKGAGKKTLLSLLLNEVDRSGKEVCWVGSGEEPELPGVAKLTIDAGNMMTGDALLSSGVVQNMDVVGITSLDTSRVCTNAFQMAAGGVLVIAAIEAPDAPAAMEKLLQSGVTQQQLSALRVLISSRVLRRLCPACSVSAALPADYQSYFQQCGFPMDTLKSASGCRECDRSGYQGKLGVYDVIPFEDFLARLLAAGTDISACPTMLRQENHSSEMLGYRGFAAAAAGLTSLDEVQNVIFRKEQC